MYDCSLRTHGVYTLVYIYKGLRIFVESFLKDFQDIPSFTIIGQLFPNISHIFFHRRSFAQLFLIHAFTSNTFQINFNNTSLHFQLCFNRVSTLSNIFFHLGNIFQSVYNKFLYTSTFSIWYQLCFNHSRYIPSFSIMFQLFSEIPTTFFHFQLFVNPSTRTSNTVLHFSIDSFTFKLFQSCSYNFQ